MAKRLTRKAAARNLATRAATVNSVVYRHPVTSELQICREGVDAELQCLEQAGWIDAGVLARMKELTAQSAQNRARIVKRLLGDDGLTGGGLVVAR